MDAAITSNSPILQERLEALLVEVNGLANRLKATDPRVAIPGASRAALQVLQRFGPQTVPQIARARFSSRQNIQILINRLKDEGLVEFATNPHHKRSALVHLTSRGHAAIAEATSAEAKLSTEFLPAFSPTELSSAAEVINRLRVLLDGKEKTETSPGNTQDTSRHSETPRPENRGSFSADTAGNQPKKPESALPEPMDDGALPVSLL